MSHIGEAVGLALEGVGYAFKVLVIVAVLAVGGCTASCVTVAYFLLKG